MTWPAETITLIVRHYAPGRSYDARDPFASVKVVHLLGGGRAHVRGLLSDGASGSISKADFRELAAMLRDQHQVARIDSERRGRRRSCDIGPVPLG